MSKCSLFQVLRNPLDPIVSYYHFYQANYALGNYKRSWEEFFTMVSFLRAKIVHPYYKGSWKEFCPLVSNVSGGGVHAPFFKGSWEEFFTVASIVRAQIPDALQEQFFPNDVL